MFKKFISLILALMLCISVFNFTIISNPRTAKAETPCFTLEIAGPDKVKPGESIDMVITIKDIVMELCSVDFMFVYDSSKVSTVSTSEEGIEKMLTVSPQYTMEIGDLTIKQSRYESMSSMSSYNEESAYRFVFLDMFDYPGAVEGEEYYGLINDGDIVITVPFVVSETIGAGEEITFDIPTETVKATESTSYREVTGTSGPLTMVAETDGGFEEPSSEEPSSEEPSSEEPSSEEPSSEEPSEEPITGYCGQNVEYTLYGNGKLEISPIEAGAEAVVAGRFSERGIADKITELVIFDGINAIEANVFAACVNLQAVSLPDSLGGNIGSGCFSGCVSINKISLPQTMDILNDKVFENCTSLTSVNLPAALTAIIGMPFYGCTGLSEVIVEAGNTKYESVDGVLYEKGEKRTLVLYPANKTDESFEISGDTIIAHNAFSQNGFIQNVIIHEGVETISKEAFFNCAALSSVTLPIGLKTLEENSFKGCVSLETIHLPYTIDTITSTELPFEANTQLVVVENSYMHTVASVFEVNYVTTDVVREGMHENGISYVIYVNGVMKIESAGELPLSKPFENLVDASLLSGFEYSDLVIGEGITSICEGCFSEYNFTSVALPASVGEIVLGAFAENLYTDAEFTAMDKTYSSLWVISNCEKYTIVGKDENIEYTVNHEGHLVINGIAEGNGIIPENVFGGESNIKTNINNVAIKGKIETIAQNCFSGYENLETVSFEEGLPLRTIGSGAFSETKINGITIPASVEVISDNAFLDCASLGVVIFKSGSALNTIGENAFGSGSYHAETNDENAVIVDFLVEEKKNNNNMNYTITGKVDNTIDYVFTSETGKLTLNGNGTFNGVKKEFEVKEVEIGAGIEKLGDRCFYNRNTLKKVTFEDNSSLTTIGEWAFSYCNNLSEIKFPSSLEEIEAYAFAECTKINNLSIPAIVGDYAFYFCVGISEMDLSETEEIGKMAFYNCFEMKAVTILLNVKTIGEKAFGFGINGSLMYGFKIIGYNNTAAETYSEAHGIAFESLGGTSSEEPSSEEPSSEEPSDDPVQDIEIEGFEYIDGYLYTNQENQAGKYENHTIKKDGNIIDSNEYIGTGCVFVIEKDGVEYEVCVIYMGDTDGSGNINSTDYIRIKLFFLKTASLDGAYSLAADYDKNGTIEATDYIMIKKIFES